MKDICDYRVASNIQCDIKVMSLTCQHIFNFFLIFHFQRVGLPILMKGLRSNIFSRLQTTLPGQNSRKCQATISTHCKMIGKWKSNKCWKKSVFANRCVLKGVSDLEKGVDDYLLLGISCENFEFPAQIAQPSHQN